MEQPFAFAMAQEIEPSNVDAQMWAGDGEVTADGPPCTSTPFGFNAMFDALSFCWW